MVEGEGACWVVPVEKMEKAELEARIMVRARTSFARSVALF